MQTIPVDKLEGHLAEFIEDLGPDQEVILTRDEKPVAILRTSPSVQRKVPQLGSMKGSVPYIAPDFDDIPEGFEEYLP